MRVDVVLAKTDLSHLFFFILELFLQNTYLDEQNSSVCFVACLYQAQAHPFF